ncbi:MAG: Do family serine endopeptidase [bacterium]
MTRLLSVLSALFLLLAQWQLPAYAKGTPDGFADLVENLSPAVVYVSAGHTVKSLSTGDPQIDSFQDKMAPENVSIGSGFIIDPSGIVITNHHVVRDQDVITVILNDGREFTAKLQGSDKETDIAVLQLEGAKGLPAVNFGDSSKARVGDWVVAIGNPFGLGGSVSAGIISARNRDINSGLYDNFIQTDAAINRGNSGGPLFNMQGDVIGVNTAIFSQSGGSVGVGFAVPSDLAQSVAQQLIQYGETRRGWLGVTLEDIDKDRSRQLGLPHEKGALVVGVRPNSPALFAGIQQQDFIIRFADKVITEVRDLTRVVAETPVGSTVPVSFIRDGVEQSARVKLTRREDVMRMSELGRGFKLYNEVPEDSALTASGLMLQKPTSKVRDAYGIGQHINGVVVTAIDPNSPISSKLQPGDVITKLAFQDVNDPATLAARLDKLRNISSGPVMVEIRRGDVLFHQEITP